MDERATHARLHELYTRLHPETGDHALTWREGLREFLETLGAHEATPPWERDWKVPEKYARAGGLGGVESAGGERGTGADAAAEPGRPPTT